MCSLHELISGQYGSSFENCCMQHYHSVHVRSSSGQWFCYLIFIILLQSCRLLTTDQYNYLYIIVINYDIPIYLCVYIGLLMHVCDVFFRWKLWRGQECSAKGTHGRHPWMPTLLPQWCGCSSSGHFPSRPCFSATSPVKQFFTHVYPYYPPKTTLSCPSFVRPKQFLLQVIIVPHYSPVVFKRYKFKDPHNSKSMIGIRTNCPLL